MGHDMRYYKPTARGTVHAWCVNPKHTRCRGVLWHRVGHNWRRPVGPVREYLRLLGDVLRATVAEVRPWLLVAAVGIAYGFAIAAVLLAVAFF